MRLKLLYPISHILPHRQISSHGRTSRQTQALTSNALDRYKRPPPEGRTLPGRCIESLQGRTGFSLRYLQNPPSRARHASYEACDSYQEQYWSWSSQTAARALLLWRGGLLPTRSSLHEAWHSLHGVQGARPGYWVQSALAGYT